jgi:flagellar hook-length control protein FliK
MELLTKPDVLPQLREMAVLMEELAPETERYEGLLAQVNVAANTEQEVIEKYVLEGEFGNLESSLFTKIVTTDTPLRIPAVDTEVAEAVKEQETTVISAESGQQTEANMQQQANAEPIVFVPMTEAVPNSVPVAEVAIPTLSAPVDPQSIIEQITRHFSFEVRGDFAEIRFTLSPEHLGDVSMRIATHNGFITAQFIAENQRVKEIIETGFNQLRDALEAQGIAVSQMEVYVNQEGRGSQQFNSRRNISSSRIEDIMEAAMAEEAERTADNLTDGSVDIVL